MRRSFRNSLRSLKNANSRRSLFHTFPDLLLPTTTTTPPTDGSVPTDTACLADEELRMEEDTVEDTRKQAEDESRRLQLEAQKREEEKRIREEKM